MPTNNKIGGRVSHGTAGKRADLGIYVRSAWEANYLRWLNFIGEPWEYEKREFVFEKIKRGNRTYRPDVFLSRKNEWHEVKGWMDNDSRVKLKRMAQFYPSEKIIIIGKEFFQDIERKKLCRIIPGWECRHVNKGE